MAEINLLRSLPVVKRNVQKRAVSKDPSVVAIAKEFGEMYWDGPREYGYGGYEYDGRWRSVAQDIVNHFDLSSGMRVLDIGCGKGFLVKDLMQECPGLEAFGLDISIYALNCAPTELSGRLHLGNAEKLPFQDNSFDCVLAVNVIHNLHRSNAIKAISEIERISRSNRSYIVVDSYHTQEQKELFESWVLTAEYHDFPDGWHQVFLESGYTGDWSWTIVE